MPEAPTFDLRDVSRLLQGAADGRHPTRDVALVRLLLDTACRPSEVQALTWNALIDGAGRFTGKCAFQSGKGGRHRTVTLSAATVESLRALHAETKGKRNDPVFLSRDGVGFNGAALRLTIIAIGKRAKMDVSAYSIRHAVLTRKGELAASKGATASDLAAWSGHASESNVLRYVQPSAAMVRALDTPDEH